MTNIDDRTLSRLYDEVVRLEREVGLHGDKLREMSDELAKLRNHLTHVQGFLRGMSDRLGVRGISPSAIDMAAAECWAYSKRLGEVTGVGAKSS